MEFLTSDECVKWCQKRGYPAGAHEGYIVPVADKNPDGFHFMDFTIPSDSGAKVAFARFLYSLLKPQPEFLLWLGEWGVWSLSQHMPLVARFRECFGESRRLIDSPGHLCKADETDDAISVLIIALEFIWDCHVISASGRDAIFISHDEYGWYGSRNPSEAALARTKIDSEFPGSIFREKQQKKTKRKRRQPG